MNNALYVSLVAALCNVTIVVAAADLKPLVVSFGDRSFIHRWSKNNQNEFTPEKQTDLTKWEEMITLNVHPDVKDGDQLARLANAIRGNYERAGRILRTDSKPRTEEQPAEHFIVAIVGAPGVMETSFARAVLVDGTGVVIVYSRRAYGALAAETLGSWLQTNGPATEGDSREVAAERLGRTSHRSAPRVKTHMRDTLPSELRHFAWRQPDLTLDPCLRCDRQVKYWRRQATSDSVPSLCYWLSRYPQARKAEPHNAADSR